MNIFVIGATGYIGSAIVERLRVNGHTVLGLARSEEAAAKIHALDAAVWQGDITNISRLAEAVHEVDGVIYTAQSQEADMLAIEQTAVTALLKALAGSNKPFIFTSGCGLIGNTGPEGADENSVPHPPAFFVPRLQTETMVVAAAPAVHTIVIRPALVYGRRAGAFAALIAAAKKIGAAPYVGDGENHWPTIHVMDVADLYVRALERAPSGSLFHGTNANPSQVRQIAKAIGQAAGLDGRTVSWTYRQAEDKLGLLAGHFLLDQHIKSENAQRILSWQPTQPGPIEELVQGSYR